MAGKLQNFWERISDGIAIQQLWEQFRSDARASYQFYAKELETGRNEQATGRKQFGRVVRGLFWAIIMKLSPARRVLLLIALVILFLPSITVRKDNVVHNGRDNVRIELGDFRFWSEAIVLALLVLELADRVTMKRDLEIAREIQSWLMPAVPPDVSGVDIAFATRPANTVAGDYYDAFLLPNGRLLIVVADVAGKSVP